MKTLWILALVLISHSAFGGSRDGAGGDWESVEFGSAWFLGDETITYCYEGDLGLGKKFDKAKIEKELDGAFETWKTYLKDKNLNTVGFITGQRFNLIFNHKLLPKGCDGTERLKFYLGVTNKQIEEEKKKFTNALALVRRTDFNDGFGKGFVYVAPQLSINAKANVPNWEAPFAFQSIVTHEMGHILGCEHINGTIMSRWHAHFNLFALFDLMRKGKDMSQDKFYRYIMLDIDHEHELEHNHKFERIIPGYMPEKKLKTFFKEVAGRDPIGKVVVKMIDGGPRMSLQMEDDKKSFGFAISGGTENENCDQFEQGRTFKAVNANSGYIDGMFNARLSYGSVCDAKLHISEKISRPIQIIRNSKGDRGGLGQEYIRIREITPNGRELLFNGEPKSRSEKP